MKVIFLETKTMSQQQGQHLLLNGGDIWSP